MQTIRNRSQYTLKIMKIITKYIICLQVTVTREYSLTITEKKTKTMTFKGTYPVTNNTDNGTLEQMSCYILDVK